MWEQDRNWGKYFFHRKWGDIWAWYEDIEDCQMRNKYIVRYRKKGNNSSENYGFSVAGL